MNRAGIAGVILAAGASSRMGQPKALLEYQGEAFLRRLARMLGEVCGRVVVVLGYDAERVRVAVPEDAEITVNPEPGRGMLSSLQCGLRAAGDAESVLFLPVDYGAVRGGTVARVAAEAGTAEIVVPVFEGRHGHPVCISRAIAVELLALPATAQARDVIRRHRAATHYIIVDDAGVVNDVDTPEDYRALVEAQR
ncbi:MAG: nucleotidyltransferase family protein [Bryobacteraceae bacterium]